MLLTTKGEIRVTPILRPSPPLSRHRGNTYEVKIVKGLTCRVGVISSIIESLPGPRDAGIKSEQGYQMSNRQIRHALPGSKIRPTNGAHGA